ncbi:MAG: nucleotidyltransferase domain-containing protein [Acidobacteria bacterium]|nr:nucleotidyltransferase domain-containing protein [Acidobacteriota bacterium]
MMYAASDSRIPRYLDDLAAILREALDGKKCRVYLFGSRARGDAGPVSDIDLGVYAEDAIDRELSLARERMEESNIPLKVDLVDLRTSAPELRRAVEREGVLLWSN